MNIKLLTTSISAATFIGGVVVGEFLKPISKLRRKDQDPETKEVEEENNGAEKADEEIRNGFFQNARLAAERNQTTLANYPEKVAERNLHTANAVFGYATEKEMMNRMQDAYYTICIDIDNILAAMNDPDEENRIKAREVYHTIRGRFDRLNTLAESMNSHLFLTEQTQCGLITL